MDLFNFDPNMFLGFLLTFIRISIVLFMLPIFSVDGLPTQWKAAICMILTLVLYPKLGLPGTLMPTHPFGIALILVGEVFMGLVLGLAVNFFFAGIQSGGEILAMQMGFSMITLADPLSGNNTGLIAHFLYMVATLIFLALDGHLYLIKAFSYSFHVVPPGGLMIREVLLTQVVELSSMVFVFGVRIAAPVMAALFLTEVALGLMTRAAPQIQIMEVGFPLKICVGFFFVGLLFVIISEETRRFIIGLDGMFLNLLRSMGPATQ
ncbi:MAG: flagellar biosynthetic protein FliR [Bilophila sp.]